MRKDLSTKECLESMPRAFLNFVHQDHLWAFAPDQFRRWRPAKDKPGRWDAFPFVWDFGADVVVPEFWTVWLTKLYSEIARKGPKELISDPIPGVTDSDVEAVDFFVEGIVQPGERCTIAAKAHRPFRGRNVVCDFSDGIENIRLWGLFVTNIPQMKCRKGGDGRDVPWEAMDFLEEFLPVNLKLDTCPTQGLIKVDVENVGARPVRVVVKISGLQLVKKTT